MKRRILAATAAVVGALPAAPATAQTTEPLEPGDLGGHCGTRAATGETRCHDTFAEQLAWIGVTGVDPDVTPEEWFGENPPTDASGRDYPPGYAYGMIYDTTRAGSSWVYWAGQSSCVATAWSLQSTANWNNRADGVANGVCGTMKLFDAWSGAGCNTDTHLTTVRGGWDAFTQLPTALRNRTSCIVFGA